jgi:hypothetical protein
MADMDAADTTLVQIPSPYDGTCTENEEIAR